MAAAGGVSVVSANVQYLIMSLCNAACVKIGERNRSLQDVILI